jgi:hypothetical protein
LNTIQIILYPQSCYFKVIILLKANIYEDNFYGQGMRNTTTDINSNPVTETPQERRERFLLEFEKPFKCEKCNERFKKKKYLREHKTEAHSY